MKPFAVEELMARLLPRPCGCAAPGPASSTRCCGVADLAMDEDTREILRDGEAPNADPDRVRGAAIPDAEVPDRAHQGADPRPCLEMPLRRPFRRRRARCPAGCARKLDARASPLIRDCARVSNMSSGWRVIPDKSVGRTGGCERRSGSRWASAGAAVPDGVAVRVALALTTYIGLPVGPAQTTTASSPRSTVRRASPGFRSFVREEYWRSCCAVVERAPGRASQCVFGASRRGRCQ